MILIAIDPGSTHSAAVVMSDGDLMRGFYCPNETMIHDCRLHNPEVIIPGSGPYHLAIETIHCRAGQFIQDSHLQTQLWAGRFIEAFGGPFTCVRRERVKGHFGVQKDSELRESLIGRFGGAAAVGGVKCKRCHGKGWSGRWRQSCEPCGKTGWEVPPGPFYDWTGSDRWAALAIACWWFDTQKIGAVNNA